MAATQPPTFIRDRPVADSPGVDAPALHRRAMDNLEFIRDTMARAATVTAVSGWGIAAAGTVGLGAAALAARTHDGAGWTAVWLGAATLALPLSAGASLLKARRTARARGTPVFTASGRRLLLSFLPPFTVAALLTVPLAHAGLYALLPTLWLLSYGAGIATGGAFSVRPVPVMGLTFLALGALALCGDLLGPRISGATLDLPHAWGNACMGLGFGLVHLGFGAYIARRHGG